MKDLLEDYEIWPDELAEVMNRFIEHDNTYEYCAQLEKELNAIGYGIDWYLDAEPFNLIKL